MDSADRGARRRTLEIPAKPDTGLAEWTSKIKALQRQVDEDEEAEHKRLEDEIAASRAARMRRSVGAGSRGNSVDLCEDHPTTRIDINQNRGLDYSKNGCCSQFEEC